MDLTSVVTAAVLLALLAGWYAWLESSERRKSGRHAGRRMVRADPRRGAADHAKKYEGNGRV